jgi:glycosyltransferase involved in cell wall biosynthesis
MAEIMPGYMKKDHRIVYHGCVSMEESVAAQLSAYILVNPRPTSEEFTKYSFPSKNIEYMASGAPLLTTCLPGMPKEYYDYVFLFEEETVEGMSKTLNNILKMSEEDVQLKGQRGKEFVLSQKNNIVQAEKLYRLLTL